MIRNISVLVMYNDEGKILLQHRSKTAKRLPDYWGFFGGGIEEGESPEQALIRELKEELEYNIDKPTFLFKQSFTWKEDNNIKYVYICKYDNNQKLTQHEGQGMQWLLPDNTNELLIVVHDREIVSQIKKYLEHNNYEKES